MLDIPKFLAELAEKSPNYPRLELKLAADRFIELEGKLEQQRISHPTDICECRFDCSDGDMKVRHQCGYHKGIADRLDASEKRCEQWAKRWNMDLGHEIAEREKAERRANDDPMYPQLMAKYVAEQQARIAAESRLDSALALVREVLSGEAQPSDWNPRARVLLGVVEKPAPMASARAPVEPDQNGDCKRCGLGWSLEEIDGTDKHECPFGFLSE